MLIEIVLADIHAHPGQPIAPHDVWGSWNPDPLILAASLVLGWAYIRGNRGAEGLDSRSIAFGLGMGAVLIALTSPLDAVAGSLASAHMVQHMLLVVVAGPLLAWSRPLSTMLRGSPRRWRKTSGRWRHRAGLTPSRLRWLSHPGAAWLTLAGVMWVWHSASLYGAALRHEAVHALEHLTFLLAAVWFWSTVLEGVWGRRRSLGMGILLLFTMAMQGVLLSAVMTFATSPWYPEYLETAPLWGLEPLADQQLAGLIMWIPSGLIYTGAALALLLKWIGDSERPRSRPSSVTVERPAVPIRSDVEEELD